MQLLPITRDNLIAVRVSGTLTSQEIDYFKALQREVIEQYGEVRLYFEMESFDGWQADSFLDNALFDLTHAHLYRKVAMVGEKTWQAWITKLANLIKSGEVKYFDLDERALAVQWVQQGSLRTMEG
jgi:hypothetical protein